MFHFLILVTMCLLYILNSLIPSHIMNLIFTIITIVVFFQAFYKLQKNKKVFTGFLFFAGVGLHLLYGHRGLNVFSGITQNLPLLAIIILAPLLSIPLKGEGLLKGITEQIDENKKNEFQLFNIISYFMLLLGPILNMGALRIVHGFVENFKFDHKLLSKAYFGGFTPAILWSPFFASVGIVLADAHIAYLSYLPIGITFAVIHYVLAILILRPKNVLDLKVQKNSNHKRTMRTFIFTIIVLIGFLIGLEKVTHLPMLLLVSIICIFIPLLWTFVRNKVHWMRQQMIGYKQQLESNTNLEVALFLSAGLFGNALINTPITAYLKQMILWSSRGTVVLIFLFVVFFITLMAFLGIHQIIAIPIILQILLAPELNITISAAAFICIFSWMFSSSISPLNALNIIISSCVHENGLRIAYKWNGKFFLSSLIMASVYVLLINQI